jgi:PAS domain S-box-containing protein
MRSRLLAFAISLIAVVVAVGIRWVLDPVLGDSLPLVTLYGAVALSVWVGGYAPATVIVIIGYFACNYLFIQPRGEWFPNDVASVVGLVAYLCTCSIIIALGEAMQRAQRQTELRRETLRITLASIGDAVITTDASACITSMNPIAEKLTKWKETETIGKSLDTVFRIINEQTRGPVDNPAMKALREGAIAGLANHTILVRKDGSELPIDDSAGPILDNDKRVVGCVLIFRDITERRNLERQLAERLAAARFLASIVKSSEDAIVSKSLEGIIQSWNSSAEKLFGYSANEVIGKHISLIIPPDRAAEEEQIISRIRAGERVHHFDTVRQRKDGKFIHISLTVSPVMDEAGRVIGASKIAREITDRKEAEQRIYGLMAELKEVDRRKDEFLATLSHELRGPLAPIANILETLRRTPGDAQLLSEARDTLERQLSQLVRLVDDLIDVNRITHGKIELKKERVELSSVIQQSVEASRPLAACAGHHINITMAPETIYIDGDRVRLVQIFTNLLSNACKYTEKPGHITITVKRHGSDAVVAVADTGIGIPPDKLESIFDMFSQVERTSERSQAGLGIGLTLVRRLVEMHDGTVEAQSQGLGYGSEFRIHLPILLEHDRRAIRKIAAPPTNVMPRTILVVDDNVDAANSLVRLLRVSGHQTHVAHDGLEAVASAQRYLPDVVLMDVGLPKIDGHEACRRIRNEPWSRNMLMIALTGWSQEEDRRKSKEAGFNAHMVKPLNYDELMRLLGADRALAT